MSFIKHQYIPTSMERRANENPYLLKVSRQLRGVTIYENTRFDRRRRCCDIPRKKMSKPTPQIPMVLWCYNLYTARSHKNEFNEELVNISTA